VLLNEIQKRCCECQVEKSFNEFYKNKKSKDGLEYKCKKCTKKRDSLRHQKRLTEKKKWILDFKTNNPCKDCKNQYHPWAMEFDHINKDKTCCISEMMHKRSSLKRLKKEVDKCELVCANCHRIRTYNRIYNPS